MLRLIGDADSVELKLTVPDEDRQSAAAALGVDPLDARIRQVFFFDTPDLLLDQARAQARRRQLGLRQRRRPAGTGLRGPEGAHARVST